MQSMGLRYVRDVQASATSPGRDGITGTVRQPPGGPGRRRRLALSPAVDYPGARHREPVGIPAAMRLAQDDTMNPRTTLSFSALALAASLLPGPTALGGAPLTLHLRSRAR